MGDVQTLAQQAKVHRNTVARAPGSEKLQSYLRDVMRVIAALTDLQGDVQLALFWYRNQPIPTFDYRTSERIVADGETEALIRYLAMRGESGSSA